MPGADINFLRARAQAKIFQLKKKERKKERNAGESTGVRRAAQLIRLYMAHIGSARNVLSRIIRESALCYKRHRAES